MELTTNNTGILDAQVADRWSTSPHAGLNRTSSDEDELNQLELNQLELNQLIEDLVCTTAIDAFVQKTCLSFLARFNVTSWRDRSTAIKFWCQGCDATFHSHVATNPLNRHDPPLCLLSVSLGGKGRTFYGSVVADLRGAGSLFLSHAVRSIIVQALDATLE